MSTHSSPHAAMSSLRRTAPAERVYCVMLRAYPPEFRAAYGREMRLLFRDQYRLRGAGILGFWLGVLSDIGRSAPALRIESWRTCGHEDSVAFGGIMRPVAMLTVLLGAFGTLSAVIEGVAGMRQGGVGTTYLIAIVLGAIAGALLFVAGLAAMRGTPPRRRAATRAALGSLLAFLTARLAFGWMSVVLQLTGIVLPLAILAGLHWRRRRPEAP